MPTVRRDSIVLAMVFVCSSMCRPQPYIREVDGIPVTVGGEVIAQPFAGGVNAPKHEFVDIDGDGDDDLFVLDNDNVLDFYKNEGSAEQPDFRLCRGCVAMPRFLFWFLFVDLNGDGTLDLCTDDSSSGVRYYRNEGTPQAPLFVLQTPTLLDSAGNPMNAGFSSVPAFADIDGDSLIDFLSSNSLDGSVNFYKNIGTRASPRFRFITGAFQGITVIGDTCYAAALMKNAHHGAGVLTYVDIDSNGTDDMFYGDLYSHGVFFMQNTGTAAQPHLICATNRYPDPSLLTLGFNQPSFVDIDHDGDLDLFVGVLNNLERHGFWFYENIGSASSPNFHLVTRDYLSVIDAGANASPAMADIDGDGLPDLFLGTLDGTIWYFKNTGTRSAPAFALVDTVFGGITGNYLYAPAFVDIDGDGDMDLFIGRFDGHIAFYRNIGSAGAPQFAAEASPVDTITVLQNASPAFGDLDGDGDQDLLVGKANGRISLYRNDGDALTFSPVLVTAQFAGIDVGEDAKPVLADIDGDGGPDLVVGNASGALALYHNDQGQSWTPDTAYFSFIDPVHNAAPVFADVDGDGDADLVIGTSKGGLHFYRNGIMAGIAEDPGMPAGVVLYQNYPNPFNPATDIRYELPVTSDVALTVYDLLGREIATLVDGVQHAGHHTVRFFSERGTPQVNGGLPLTSGVYYYALRVNSGVIVRSMLMIK